jgi:hypothetical protein
VGVEQLTVVTKIKRVETVALQAKRRRSLQPTRSRRSTSMLFSSLAGS